MEENFFREGLKNSSSVSVDTRTEDQQRIQNASDALLAIQQEQLAEQAQQLAIKAEEAWRLDIEQQEIERRLKSIEIGQSSGVNYVGAPVAAKTDFNPLWLLLALPVLYFVFRKNKKSSRRTYL